MVNCLNLTEIGRYVAAYCTNPPRDDDCPFDFCPNPEIAGMNLITDRVFLFSHCGSQARWSGSQVGVAEYSCFNTLISFYCADYVTTFCAGMWCTVLVGQC